MGCSRTVEVRSRLGWIECAIDSINTWTAEVILWILVHIHTSTNCLGLGYTSTQDKECPAIKACRLAAHSRYHPTSCSSSPYPM